MVEGFLLKAIESLYSGDYDGDRAFGLYCSGATAQELIESMLPLIQIVYYKKFRNVREPFIREEMMGEAIRSVMAHLDKRSSEYSEESNFSFRYMWIAYRAMQKALTVQSPPEEQNLYLPITHSTLPHPENSLRALYLEQLPDELLDMVVNSIRFSGDEFFGCVYIAQCLVRGARPIQRKLRKEYNVKGPDFYIDYVRVLVRKSLYAIREQPATLNCILRDYRPTVYENPSGPPEAYYAPQ